MLLIDTIPLILAIIAVYVSANKYKKAIADSDKLCLLLCMIVSIILIIAQTSLFVSKDILSNTEDSPFAPNLWVAFDCIVMILIIFYPIKK